MIWREKRVLLSILGVLLVANTIFFFTYRVQYVKRLQALDARLEDAETKLQKARAMRISAEQQIAGYRKVETDLQAIYNSNWSTKSRRLTAVITEVKRLTVASQLVPQTLNFSEAVEANKGNTEGTSTVNITFSVQGSYQQIRRLINLLELSDQFVIIDAIGLGGGNTDLLTLNVRLKTLFRQPVSRAMMNKQL